MQGFLSAVLIVLLIGIGGFLYRGAEERAAMERPAVTPSAQQSCAQDAKVCPDGTSVGRTNPNCTFATCAAPNIENAALGIAYVAPAAGVSSTSIRIQSFPIPAGKTANDVILANTVHATSGAQAKSLSEFSPVLTNGKTYQSITTERFEGIVTTEYYLARANDVLRFDATDMNVTNWNDSKLDVTKLPMHQELLQMLSTLQSTS